MKKVKVTLLALAYVMVFVTDMQAQTTERQDAVGKFRIVPAVMLTFNPYSVDDKFQFELRFCAGITDVVKDKCSVSRNCIILSAGIRL